MALAPLPVDPWLDEIVRTLRAEGALVLEAEPGAGKTTRVPRALMEAGLLGDGDVWILEPRRLAARLAACRVAEELGEAVGGRAGYAVRFEQRVSRTTRIRFVTEALLLRRMLTDPDLQGISAVLLDEFHERSLHTDLALALLRELRGRRPDLRLLAMSATLEGEPLAAWLRAPRLRVPGRPHPVEVRHQARPDARPLPQQVREAVAASLSPQGGHFLVFLPGAAEIRACQQALGPLAEARGLRVLPLHGSLGLEAQREALAPCQGIKVLLSTNVAESSVTLDGVRTVIDSGLSREASHSPWSGLPSLRTHRISQARCAQRAGRAGRQGPGLCLRLFTEEDFRLRPSQDAPELTRADLAGTVLALRALGREPRGFPWFEPPPEAHVEAADRLLEALGAWSPASGLSPVGRAMLASPLHPRLARLVCAGEELGIPGLARLAAALLETGDLAARSHLDGLAPEGPDLDCDLWPRLDAFREARQGGFSPGACRAAGLDPGALQRARLAWRALSPGREAAVEDSPEAEERLRQALLLAFPDRVARRSGGATFAFCGGSGARMGRSRVRHAQWVVALEAAEEVRGPRREVRLDALAAVEPEWLLEYFPHRISEDGSLAVHPGTGRVERRARLRFEDLVLEETVRPGDPADPDVAATLAEAALGRPDPERETLLDRLAFLARVRPDLDLPPRDSLRARLVAKASEGRNRLQDLEGLDWLPALREVLGGDLVRLLEAWAPPSVQLPRRRVRVEYGGEAPWIASRLQDFLGLREGPRIAGGSVTLVLHLLAPNQRPVQVTTDLAGFWRRAYRELRPALSRRYPRHDWPEAPEGV